VPAAAVIPAPIAYIKVVAVKKLVVGFLTLFVRSGLRVACWFERVILPMSTTALHWVGGAPSDLLL
jgi:hypothetical protein